MSGLWSQSAPADADMKAWAEPFMEASHQSTYFNELQSQIKFFETSSDAALVENPYNLKTSTDYTMGEYNPDIYTNTNPIAVSDFRKLTTWDVNNTLSYERRNSFSLAFVATTNSYVVQKPSTYLDSTEPFTLSLTASYDMLKGGHEAPGVIQAQQGQWNAKGNVLGRKNDVLSYEIAIYQKISTYFSTVCKLKATDNLNQTVQNTLKVAGLQMKTNTISQKDYLNYQDLDMSFKRRVAALKKNLILLELDLSSYGISPEMLVQKTSNIFPDCQKLRLDTTPLRISEAATKTDYQINSIRYGAAAKDFEIRLVKNGFKPSLKPYATYSLTRDEGFGNKLNNFTVGVSFLWNFETDPSDTLVRQAILDRESQMATLREAYTRLTTRMNSLKNEFAATANEVQVQDLSIANARRLVEIIALQKKIGTADSLNHTTALLSLLDVELLRLDSIYKMDQLRFEFDKLNAEKR